MSFNGEFSIYHSDYNSSFDIISDLKKRKNSSLMNSKNNDLLLIEIKDDKNSKSKTNYDIFNLKKSEITLTEENNTGTDLSNNPSPKRKKNLNILNKFNKVEEMFNNQKNVNNTTKNNYKLIATNQVKFEYKSFNLKEFEELNKILINLFCYNKFIKNDEYVKKYNIEIINAIIKRKYGEEIEQFYKHEDNIKINKKLVEDLENIFSLTYKRKEENIKLIMKSSIKNMFKIFLKNNDIFDNLKKNEKNKYMKKFYTEYFEEICKDMNLDISNFYLPKTNFKNKSIFKSFNSKYFNLICKNQKFINELKEFILNSFTDCKIIEKIKKKINLIVEVWEKKIMNNEITYEKIIEDIKNNKKLKLPWSFTEIYSAKNMTLKKLI